MAIETEIKLRVDSHDPIRDRLRALGATFVGEVLETNCVLDRLDGYLRRLGCGLRVRRVVAPDGQPGPSTLTFKGPRRVGDLKSREEIQTSIGDADALTELLPRLGFHVVLCYEKRRESWRLGPCMIELDEPAALGLFVEIEGPDDASVRAAQRDLQLTTARPVNVSYVGMIAALCDVEKFPNRTVAFPH